MREFIGFNNNSVYSRETDSTWIRDIRKSQVPENLFREEVQQKNDFGDVGMFFAPCSAPKTENCLTL